MGAANAASFRKVRRRASLVAGFTLASRIAGFARDAVMARAFGAGMFADAFNYAFLIPNSLRRFLAEGATSIALVPVFGEVEKREGREGLQRLYRRTLGIYLVGLVLVLGALTLVLPRVIPHLVRGFDDPEKRLLTAELAVYLMPFILLLSLGAVCIGVLHTLRRFTAPAAWPILFNLAIIASVVFLAPRLARSIEAAVIGVLAGGLLMLLLQWWALRRQGVRTGFELRWDPAIGRMALLMGPALIGTMVYEVNILFSKFLASYLPQGSITYVYYSDRIFELPLGILAVSVATVTLPELSAQFAGRQWESFQDTILKAVRLSCFDCLPVAVGLFAVREPLIRLFFERGHFTPHDTAMTIAVFECAVPGIIFVAVLRVVVQVFYSLQRPLLAVGVAAVSFVSNAAAALMLIGPLAATPEHAGSMSSRVLGAVTRTMSVDANMGVRGLTAANSISSFVQVSLLVWLALRLLRARGAPPLGRKLTEQASIMSRMLLSAAVMGAVVIPIVRFSRPFAVSAVTEALLLAGTIAAGALVYAGAAIALKVPEMQDVVGKLRGLARRGRRH